MLHPPQNLEPCVLFRNDDVSYDTDIQRFVELTNIFHRAGFVQLNGITLYGLCNYTLKINGEPWIYEDISREEYHEYEKCVEVSRNYYIGDNRKLIDFLNSIPDPVALHGLYHSDYSRMTGTQQENDIMKGLSLLKELFPQKKIRYFVPPFNKANEDTYRICCKYGLRILTTEGEHLEDRIAHNKGPIYEGEIYRYHHHRFYPETTFNYYELSLDKLNKYFLQYSFTYNCENARYRPSLGMLSTCGLYSEDDMDASNKTIVDLVEQMILRYVDSKCAVIQIHSGAGELLNTLWYDGFETLYGIEEKTEVRKKCQKISDLMGSKINYFTSYKDIILEVRDIFSAFVLFDFNLLSDIEEAFDFCVRRGKNVSYFFWIGRFDLQEDVIDLAIKYNSMMVERRCIEDQVLLVFRRKKPKICLYCDRRNWAHDHNAQQIRKHLLDEYVIDIRYVVDQELVLVDDYDAFLVFWWGEHSYKWKTYSKSRIIKQVSSHRWQYDKPYGPINVSDFYEKYLNDASTVICPSEIIYRQLKGVCDNLYICGKGFDDHLFYYKKKRTGEISFCMVGNLKDPIKGVEDILQPSCRGYRLDIESDLPHDKLNDFYNEHDIYVVASVHEGDPLPLIEAMACGCFVISSRIGIAPELIRHKENGYLVKNRTLNEFMEAVKWCADNLSTIRKKAPIIAAEIKEKRSWKKKAEAYRSMFREHIKRR